MPSEFSHIIDVRQSSRKVIVEIVGTFVMLAGITAIVLAFVDLNLLLLVTGLLVATLILLLLFLIPLLHKGGTYSVEVTNGRLIVQAPPRSLFLNIGPSFDIPISEVAEIIAMPFDSEDPLTYGVRTRNGIIYWINTSFGGKDAVPREKLADILLRVQPKILVVDRVA